MGIGNVLSGKNLMDAGRQFAKDKNKVNLLQNKANQWALNGIVGDNAVAKALGKANDALSQSGKAVGKEALKTGGAYAGIAGAGALGANAIKKNKVNENTKLAENMVEETFEKLAARRMDKYLAEVAKMDKQVGAMASKKLNKAVNAIGKTVDPLAERQKAINAMKPYMEQVAKGKVVPDKALDFKTFHDMTADMPAIAKNINSTALRGDKVIDRAGKVVKKKGNIVYDRPVDTVNRAYKQQVRSRQAMQEAAKTKTIDHQISEGRKFIEKDVPKAYGDLKNTVKKVYNQVANDAARTGEAAIAGEMDTLRRAGQKFLSPENMEKYINEENARKVMGASKEFVMNKGKEFFTNNKDKITGAAGGAGAVGAIGGANKLKNILAKGGKKAVEQKPLTAMQKANKFIRENPAQVGLGVAGGVGALGGAYALGKGNNSEKTASELVDKVFNNLVK